ncbi:hypothetical protein ASPWEDRAFT_70284 [Aspergillus wentii DTO 134E9]|uniref:DUF4440 domain-containing protein n=1 Tax=Aspergillus wentii DTO 134E9 TaxID=1073089 RepID=A0A1L9RCC8_ASPWE|nr:uncharacterized protein ASPWEDRAFT_70284 [Aspergillus wentii DTO 134E9]KAI9924174.1 hypothetical protein MW887_007124 [Aspergillus wentii]OJJ32589.1 hypothetical protein ASPWEDRAFT_70284 [Aspergillus wentii DTO 134E9]
MANIESVSPSVYEEVYEIAEQFVKGLYSSNSKNVAPLFHPKAVVFGDLGGNEYLNGSLLKKFELVDAGLPPNMTAQFTIIGLTNTTAVIKVEKGTGRGFDGSDFVTMIRKDGKWLIVSKVFDGYSGWFTGPPKAALCGSCYGGCRA